MIGRLRDGAIMSAVVAGLAVVALIGWVLGQRLGEPDPVEVPAIQSPSIQEPPRVEGFLGFEGIGGELRLGFWGTVTEIEVVGATVSQTNQADEPVEREVLVVTLASGDGSETTLTMDTAEFVRVFDPVSPQTGDRILVRSEAAGTTVLITRLGGSSEQ